VSSILQEKAFFLLEIVEEANHSLYGQLMKVVALQIVLIVFF